MDSSFCRCNEDNVDTLQIVVDTASVFHLGNYLEINSFHGQQCGFTNFEHGRSGGQQAELVSVPLEH